MANQALIERHALFLTYKNLYTPGMDEGVRPVRWVGSALRDLKEFPRAVQRDIGQALYAAQCGEVYPSIKALKGFSSASVLEIVAPFKTDTYRSVYTTQLGSAIYVLCAFKKKAKEGRKTPKRKWT